MTKNNTPAISGKRTRGLLPGRGNAPLSGRRSAASGPRGWLQRIQATLPSAKRNAKKSGAQKVVAALGKATSSKVAHKPSTKSMLGILAGGVGAAAVAKRRHNPDPEALPDTSSVATDDARSADSPEVTATVAEPTIETGGIDTGGDHGDPRGPDPGAAA